MTLCPYIILLAVFGIGIHWTDTVHMLQESSQDRPPGVKRVANLLFYLERNPDPNAICYTLNLDERGEVVRHEPIKVFWFRYNKDPEQKELSFLQKKLAYGVKTELVSGDEFEVKIVSFPQRTLLLKRINGKDFQIFTSIAGTEAILSRVYVKFVPAKAAPPAVEYIELHGKSCLSGSAATERIVVNSNGQNRG